MLKIDRTQPPSLLSDHKTTYTVIEEDARSASYTEINTQKLRFVHYSPWSIQPCKWLPTLTPYPQQRHSCTAIEFLKKLKCHAGIPVDAGIAAALWEEGEKKTLQRLAREYSVSKFIIPGSVLLCPHGHKYLIEFECFDLSDCEIWKWYKKYIKPSKKSALPCIGLILTT